MTKGLASTSRSQKKLKATGLFLRGQYPVFHWLVGYSFQTPMGYSFQMSQLALVPNHHWTMGQSFPLECDTTKPFLRSFRKPVVKMLSTFFCLVFVLFDSLIAGAQGKFVFNQRLRIFFLFVSYLYFFAPVYYISKDGLLGTISAVFYGLIFSQQPLYFTLSVRTSNK